MKYATKRIAFLIVLILIFVPAAVMGQEQITLEEASVVLWPEYDREGVLVIYRVKLAPDVPLPTTIGFSIPTAADHRHTGAAAL